MTIPLDDDGFFGIDTGDGCTVLKNPKIVKDKNGNSVLTGTNSSSGKDLSIPMPSNSNQVMGDSGVTLDEDGYPSEITIMGKWKVKMPKKDVLMKMSMEDVIDYVKGELSDDIEGNLCKMNRRKATLFWKKLAKVVNIQNIDDKYEIVYGDIPYISIKNKTDISQNRSDIGKMLLFSQKNGYPSSFYKKDERKISLTKPTLRDIERWLERGNNPQSPRESFINSLHSPIEDDDVGKALKESEERVTLEQSLDDPTHVNESINFGVMSSAVSPDLMKKSPAFQKLRKELEKEGVTSRQKEQLTNAAYEEFVEEREREGDTLPWRMILGI